MLNSLVKSLLIGLSPWIIFQSGTAMASTSTAIENLSDKELAEAITEAQKSDNDQWCKLGPLLNEVVNRDPISDSKKYQAGYADMICAFFSEDYETAERHVDPLAKIAASIPNQKSVQQAHYIGFFAAVYGENHDAAIRRLILLGDYPAQPNLTSINKDLIYRLSRDLWKAQKNNLRISLYETMFASHLFGELDSDLQSSTASNLLESKASAGLLSVNDSDILHISTSPQKYQRMLATRIYSALWPQIAERSGDAMGNIIKLDIEKKRTYFEADSSKTEKRSDLMNALHNAGEFKEIIALGDKYLNSGTNFEELDEDDGWAINILVKALDDDGQSEIAEKLFDRLTDLPVEDRGWLVNFIINRAARYFDQNAYQKAYDAALEAEPVAQKWGNEYARYLVAAYKACSAYQLGMNDLAIESYQDIADKRDDALVFAIGIAVCFDRNDDAAAWTIEAIRSNKWRENMIIALQPRHFSWDISQSNLPDSSFLIEDYPAVRAEFEKYARILPEQFATPNGKAWVALSNNATRPAK